MAVWKDQWARIERLCNRFTALNAARVSRHDSSDDYQDDVYAFFVSCYHLKDWLKNDLTAQQATMGDIETYVNNSLNLRLCGDLANGFKHLRLTRPKVDPSTGIGRRHLKVNINENLGTVELSSTFGATYEVGAGNETYDAYTIATECMND